MEIQQTLSQEPAILTKRCGRCKIVKPLTEFTVDRRRNPPLYCNCKICDRAYKRAWWHSEKGQAYYKNPENTARWKARSLTPERKRKQKAYTQSLPNKIRIAKRTYEIKLMVFEVLGGIRCANPKCLVPGGCEDVRALHIDHKIGCGAKNRLESKAMYKWVLENPVEAREKLQILCANCNMIKKYEKGEGIRFSPMRIGIQPIT